MPTEAEQHIAIAEEKVRQFLTLAGNILSIREEIQQQLSQQVERLSQTLRNRVLIALYLKALDSFDRLLVDAEGRRPECSHHLKTMAECFIYSGWVSGDAGETRANLILADGYRSKVAYHDLLEEREMANEWRELKRQILDGLQTEWDQFRDSSLEQIAIQGNRVDQYRRVYRLACEAAHVGDLFVYMPPQPDEAGLRFSDQSLMRVYVCLKFGIILACDLLHDASDSLNLNIAEQINGFRGRWRAIIEMASLGSEGPPERLATS